MAHKCFISFKTEDVAYKNHIQNHLNIDMIDRSLDSRIDSEDENYVMQVIRRDYLADSTVTIHLIGAYSAESRGRWEQRYIKRELQGSLYDGPGNTRNGVLGVVLPVVQTKIFGFPYACTRCFQKHNLVALNDDTVVREFSYNYYIPNGKCAHSEEDRYCVLVAWEDFCRNPELYIEYAFQKRTSPIASSVRVYL